MEILLLILVGLPLAGFVYERVASNRDAQQHTQPLGTLYDVGGRRLHAIIQGDGPSVVLLPGIGGTAFDWLPVQALLADHAQVLAYDRAGYNWSDDPDTEPTPQQLVEDLHALIAATGMATPVILVGHSFGGLYARLYQATYPNEVAGLVLVDASHPDYIAQRNNAREISRLRRVGVFKQIGLLRLLLRRVIDQRMERLPENMRAAYFAMTLHNTGATLREARAAFGYDLASLPTDLGALPLVVLSRQPTELASDEKWQGYQEDLATLATNSLHLTSERYNHDVHILEPQYVVDAVQHLTQQRA